ncbi:LamG domain-containing protein [Hymenobacter sp.]|uniref:LamG domain-containing protein n=1 Tax=Hymenobacter sp. TaxID=1898978 RepID=UPI00286CD227|nr:LamG domain-containing protein [Hymenobacter sp.]
MKKSSFYLFLLFCLLFGGMAAVSSCSDNDDDKAPQVNADKAQLTALIDSVNVGYSAAVEGTKPGSYAAGSKATLKTSIDLATTTKNDAAATQAAVNTAVANLRRAVTAFKNSLIQEVSAANLLAQYKFTGNANDATPNANNGVLKVGKIGPATAPVDGTTLPVLVADRFGRAGQAYEFAGGGYIEVPYKAALNPQALTLSVWCKRNDTNADNYLLSLNRWTGYKFQLQGDNKPFLTVTTTSTTADRDADSGIVPVNVWTHVASSYVDGTMKFYINGALVKTWTNVAGAIKAVPEPVALSIGQQLPSNIYNKVPAAGQPADYFQYYGPAFFKGQMDDIRIYNRALTDAEVQSIFTIESTL